MSEKKSKEQRMTVQYPVYSAEKNAKFLELLHSAVDMSVSDILNLIVGDWIVTFSVGSMYKDPRDVFFSFVSGTYAHSEEYKKQSKIFNANREVFGGKDA